MKLDKSSQESPLILFVSHVVPFPPSAGNEVRIYKMIQWLRSQGFRIALLLNHPKLDRKRTEALRLLVDSLYFVEDCDNGNSKTASELQEGKIWKASLFGGISTKGRRLYSGLFAKNALTDEQKSESAKKALCPEKLVKATRFLCLRDNPFAVIAEYVFATPCFDMMPEGITKIVDTHDMFSRKGKQVISYGIDDLLSCTPKEERGYLLKSDIVIAIQPQEAEMFRELVPEREVITVGIDYHTVDRIESDAQIPGTVLVVGSDNALNVHGLKEFYNNSWPLIRSKSQNAVLRIIGKIGNHLQTDDVRVQICGWVENLEEEYKKASVVINPTLAGTGLKIKSVEALCNAKPLVATSNGVEGIYFTDQPPFIVCNDWGEFANAVLMLLNSDEKRKVLQVQALEFAKNKFSSEKVYAPLAEILEKLH